MALRDQPYFPLYVDDYLTDEKLNMCSPSSQGIYIKILCIMHKSENYGCILLKQKDKQKNNTCLNFALKLARLLPFTVDEINDSLEDLLDEKVLYLEGDMLCQKRMIKDNIISVKRSNAGSAGGKSTQKKKKDFAKANTQANSVNVDVSVNEDIDNNMSEKKFNFKESLLKLGIEEQVASDWLKVRSKKKASNTETAFNMLEKEIQKSNKTANECILICVENSWKGFKSEWINQSKENLKPKSRLDEFTSNQN